MYVKRLPHGQDLPSIHYATGGSAGLDLHTAEDLTLRPGETAMVPTGIAVQIGPNHVGLVCPRSGLAAKHGVTVLNAPGVVDSDYRGEVKVLLVNHGAEDFEAKRGDRIAQLVIMPFQQPHVIETDELDETVRGEGGFGSTGK